jgi:hypothetical protein
VEEVLVSVGAVKLNDSRLSKEKDDDEEIRKTIKVSKKVQNDDDDSDWD